MSRRHVRLLKKARKTIEEGYEQYICIAIADAATPSHLHSGAMTANELAERDITSQIRLDLGGDEAGALEDWLYNEHDVPMPSDFYNMDDYKIQALVRDLYREQITRTRLAWIDALIVYWKDR